MWGQISFNASAAFTAVQEAYDNSAAKEFISGNTGSSPSRERELADTAVPRRIWGSTSMPNLDEGSGTTSYVVPSFAQRAERGWTENVRPSSQQSQRPHTLHPPPAELDDPWSNHSGRRHLERERATSVAAASSDAVQNPPKFSSASERRSPTRSSILDVPPSPSLTRSTPASPLTSPLGQLSDGSLSLREPRIRETSNSAQAKEQPHVLIISPIPLPSQNPYITAGRTPSPNLPPTTVLRDNSPGTPSLTELTLDQRDPSSRPSPSPSFVAAAEISSEEELPPPVDPPRGAREVDPLGVGFLG